jgi:hypothetical protein
MTQKIGATHGFDANSVFRPTDVPSSGSYKPKLIYFKFALEVMQGTNAAQGCYGTMSMRYTQG